MIKNTIFIISFFICVFQSLIAQNIKESKKEQKAWETGILPKNVKNTYDSLYKNNVIIKWKKSNSGIYIVKFKNKVNDKEDVARFESNGTWIETISYIKKSQVLQKVVEETEKAYPNAINIDYQILTKPKGNGAYFIDVIDEDKCYEIIYSLDGRFINIESSEN